MNSTSRSLTLSLIMLSLPIMMLGQAPCLPVNTNTDPDNASDLRGEPYLNIGDGNSGDADFDWRNQSYDLYQNAFDLNTTLIFSPFHSNGGNPNVAHLDDQPVDYEVEDGWQLLSYQYGRLPYDPANPADPADVYGSDVPALWLYNKYRGLIRVLIYSDAAPEGPTLQYALATLTRGFPGGAAYQTALLNLAGEGAQALDSICYQCQHVAFNSVFLNQDNWYHIDIPVIYDPCTCLDGNPHEFGIQYFDNLYLSIDVVEDAQVQLSGRLTGAVNVQSKVPSNTNFHNGALSVLGFGLDVANAVAKGSGKAGEDKNKSILNELNEVKAKQKPEVADIFSKGASLLLKAGFPELQVHLSLLLWLWEYISLFQVVGRRIRQLLIDFHSQQIFKLVAI